MKEYVDRGALLKELERFPHLKTAGSVVRSMPKADVVEVVRCQDCVHNENCNQYVLIMGDEGELAFCSYGERKENK